MEYIAYAAYADWLLRAAAAVLAGAAGFTVRERRKDAAGRLMCGAAFVLCVGIVCDLLTRVLGAGTLGRAAGRAGWFVALTVFLILLSLLWEKRFDRKLGHSAELLLRDVSGIRALACVALPIILLSGAMQGEGFDPFDGVPAYYRLIAPSIRSLCLLVAAGVVVRCWRTAREAVPALANVWLWLLAGTVLECAADLASAFFPAAFRETLELLALACFCAILLCLVRDAGDGDDGIA